MEVVEEPRRSSAFEHPTKESGKWAIELEKVERRFGPVQALADVSLSIRAGEFFSLLGPSGCGKTTLLRIIAGLDHPDAGALRISRMNALSVPAHQRSVNTVFQSYALFPHMTVWDNVAFGLRMKSVARAEIKRRVGEVLEMVQVQDLAGRKPHQLSGGQKQRVALARAIVNEPQVLLLDEPLGALDMRLRKQLQIELKALQRRLGITFLYVTHDQDEAVSMSDRIAVMNAGRIEQLGAPRPLYEHPRNRFVAQFLGSCNLLEGQVESSSNSSVWARTPLGLLRFECPPGRLLPRVNQPVTLAIRPENIVLSESGVGGEENMIQARLFDCIYNGAETHYVLQSARQELRACAMNINARDGHWARNQELVAALPAAGLILLED